LQLTNTVAPVGAEIVSRRNLLPRLRIRPVIRTIGNGLMSLGPSAPVVAVCVGALAAAIAAPTFTVCVMKLAAPSLSTTMMPTS
jgi:hypothetical protein